MKHNMKLNAKSFELIKAGKKTIEMRLYDNKRKMIQVGDIIEFTNIETREEMQVSVINLYNFPSFKELYKAFNQEALGYESYEIALYTDMEQYYLITDIEKYGVLGIEIRLI